MVMSASTLIQRNQMSKFLHTVIAIYRKRTFHKAECVTFFYRKDKKDPKADTKRGRKPLVKGEKQSSG